MLQKVINWFVKPLLFLFGSEKRTQENDETLLKIIAYALAHDELLDITDTAVAKALNELCLDVLSAPFHSKKYEIYWNGHTSTIYVSVYISITRGKILSVSAMGFPETLVYDPEQCLAVVTYGHGWEFFELEDLRHELLI